MPSIQLLQRKIHTAQELQAVVKMMKVLAALNIHQYEQAVTSLAEYNHTIEMALHVVLKATHERQGAGRTEQGRQIWGLDTPTLPSTSCGVIIFGSDQGMCGQFNEQISRYAIAELEKLNISPEQLAIFAVGSRIISHLETAGYAIKQTFPMAGSLTEITSMVQEILLQIAEWRDSQQIVRIFLFYNHLHSNTLCEPYKLQLLPLDRRWLQHIESKKWRSRTLPTFTMPSDVLIASLLRQYFFILLYRAFGESLAGENASRLASMQVAEKNIAERLTEFTSQFQQQRQTAITDELLEITSAFELSH
ncbi:F0F1 ATP synthase subunit gamma [Anabaena cylindrica UHCC 0172]|uniref:F0F1 ATP synthase subunit gamma n=1 Tax=Anabaena cylindrica TaxID=1165 RepID=UPI002B21543D|nr:F0F1 ATP synthase subunit gamma [Anabaena cylindrica]MEA5549603.1 F0F1 ATP synthase subunit gamma [Anabaena cylindrica UHCC 0172]